VPRLPRINLERTQFVADYGVNWRSLDEAAALVLAAKKSGFEWVAFDLFDRDYLREVRGDALKQVYERLMPAMGSLAARISALAHNERIGLMLTALSTGVVESAMGQARAMRVPLERTQDQKYTIAWARAKGNALGVYETTACWPSAAAGRMPIFVAPGYPARPDDYLSYWKSGNLRGRLGVAFHVANRDLFVRAATVGAPMVSLNVRPEDYAEAPDRSISASASEAHDWLREVRDAEV